MRVEPQALETDIGGMEAEEGDYVSSGVAFMKLILGEKIGAGGGVGFVLV